MIDMYLPSDTDIVELCERTRPFAGSIHGNQLVRISEYLVVKFGMGVRRQEAQNQSYARRNVDATILYVPQVFHFFEATLSGFKMGFLVMEYVLGENLRALDVRKNPHIAQRTIDAVQHLASIPIPLCQGPGPVGGGPAHGYLWSDDGTGCTFGSIEDMEHWMNVRLELVHQPHICFSQQQHLTMHHMDLARRNICLLPNSTICFMDWAFAGFYPDIFEIYVFRELRSTDGIWFKQLLDLSPRPDVSSERLLQILGIPAMANNMFS